MPEPHGGAGEEDVGAASAQALASAKPPVGTSCHVAMGDAQQHEHPLLWDGVIYSTY